MSRPIRFGTDGVRGPFGRFPVNPAGATAIGRGLAAWVGGPGAAVVIGRDTRESGTILEEAVVAGLVAGGVDARCAGVLPTAAVSALVAATDAAAGLMITASHNPWVDNGLKIVGPDGSKPSDTAALEAAFAGAPAPGGGQRAEVTDPAAPWRAAMPAVDLAHTTVLLDAAHGAAAAHAPGVLEARGARVLRRGCSPDGRNINDGVGALHPPTADEVRAAGADLAVCLDGDADRVLLVSPDHGLFDGDDMLWLFSRGAEGPLVGTVMSNGGLGSALGERLLRSGVGDQQVAALMRSSGAVAGAEPSGHVLFTDGLPTGDGLFAALRILQVLGPRPRLPSPGWTRWPQVQHAVRFEGEKRPLETILSIDKARQAGLRLVVRYSGTEPKLRILVEGPDEAAAVAHAAAIRAEATAVLRA